MQRVSIIGISLLSVASVGALCVLGNLHDSRTFAEEPASVRVTTAVAPRFVVTATPVNATAAVPVNSREAQIQLRVSLVELHLEKLRELGLRIEDLLGDLAKPEREGTSRVGCFNTEVLQAHLAWIRATKSGKILAEPTLIVQSGRQGNFLSGGEFPVPNTHEGVVEYRAFGTTITATPTLQPDRQIRLDLAIENSQRDFKQVLRVNEAVVPGLVSRKWQFLADVPVGKSLAMLSVSGENRRELVIVTPEIVEPANASSAATAPRVHPVPVVTDKPGVSVVTVTLKPVALPVDVPSVEVPEAVPGDGVGRAVVDGDNAGETSPQGGRDEAQILAGIQRLQVELEQLRERVTPRQD